jgi:TetR/AcrR family transcriptional regulator
MGNADVAVKFKRNPRSKESIREENELIILTAAEKVFAKHGLKGSTTKQIADMAKLPKSNIHYYFHTKLNLYRCVLESILVDWMKAADTFNTFDEPREAIRYYVGAKMDLSRTRPFGSKVWANEIISGAPEMEEILSSRLKKWVDSCVSSINTWVKLKKIINVGDAHTLLYMIWATTQHYADFDYQVMILNNGKKLSDSEFEEKKTTSHRSSFTKCWFKSLVK